MKKLISVAMRKLILMLLLLIPVNAFAAHPVIWMNATTKLDYKQQVTDNTTEWQALKGWCDTNTGTDLSSGYQMLDWSEDVQKYGMCYQMTGTEAYAVEGVKYFTALLRDRYKIGDALGGTNAIKIDSGWIARTLGSGVAISRDWLDGSTALTPALITEATTRMTEWQTWYDASGFSKNDPSDNYYAGYFAMKYLAGLAFEGDTAAALTWQAQAATMWTNKVLPWINGHLKGGDWQEGWNYGEWSAEEYLEYASSLEIAKGDATKWADTNWHHELVKSKIHMLYPGRWHVSEDGSWSGNLKGNPNSRLMAYLLKHAPLTAQEKGLASWYKQNLTYAPYPLSPLNAFIWRDTTAAIAPTAASEGLSYFISGTSRVLSRADWTDDATYVEFAAPPTGVVTQGENNIGEFKISSKQQLLVLDSDTYEYMGEFGNTLMVAGSHTYAPYQEWWHDTTRVDRQADGGAYVYARATGLESAYDGNLGTSPSLSKYDREMLFIRPNYVFIKDSVTPTSQAINTIISQVNFMGEPAISGNTLSVTNDTAKVFMSVLGHGVTISKTSKTSTRAGVWLSSIAPTATAAKYNLLHVFETADSTKSNMDTVVEITGNGCTGAIVGTETAIFADSVNVTYSTSVAGTQTIVGLSASTEYSIAISGANTLNTTLTSSSAGVLTFDLANAGATTVSLNGGAVVVEPDPTTSTIIGIFRLNGSMARVKN